jgi:hypothetical protein
MTGELVRCRICGHEWIDRFEGLVVDPRAPDADDIEHWAKLSEVLRTTCVECVQYSLVAHGFIEPLPVVRQ